MVGLWDSISLVRAVVREKENLGMFQFHHNPHTKISLHPSQTRCLNRERNQVRNQVRSLVKSLTPSLSPDQSSSIVTFVERCDNPTRDKSVLSPKPLHLVIKR
jgi:hypothetical protein